MIKLIKFVGSLLVVMPAIAVADKPLKETIAIGYGTYGGAPYFSLDEHGEISGGLTFELGHVIAKQLNAYPHFIETPVNRANSLVKDGAVDLLCLYHPDFVDEPDTMLWSEPFYHHIEYFVVSKPHKLTERTELLGKGVGTHLGYTYHPKTMEMFRSGKITRIEQQDSDKLYKMLALGRIHSLIDSELSYRFQTDTIDGAFEKSALIDREYDLSCALSKSSTLKLAKLNVALQRLKDNKELPEIIEKYR